MESENHDYVTIQPSIVTPTSQSNLWDSKSLKMDKMDKCQKMQCVGFVILLLAVIACLAFTAYIATNIAQLRSNATGNPTGGVTYVRWGRTTCDNDSKLIYSGMVASSFHRTVDPKYTTPGGLNNYLCLPDEPQWSNYNSGFQDVYGKVYGAQYDIAVNATTRFAGPVNQHDLALRGGLAACAVCMTPPSRTLKVMIPANNVCPPGWTMEYNGYIFAQGVWPDRNGARRAECFDGNPEYVLMYTAAWGGDALYYQEVACNPLPCDKYINGRELTCVVCTQ